MIPRRPHDSRVNLSSNELHHPALAGLLEHAFKRVRGMDFRAYPSSEEAAEVIGARLGLSPAEMLLTPGSDAAVRLICHHYVRSSPSTGRLLLQHPNYYAWEQSAALLDLEIERIRWSSPSEPGRELIDAAREHRGALIGLSVPNGPVGGCLSPAELAELVDVAHRQGHLLTIDSCYQAFNGEWTEHLRRRDEHVLVIQSLSKSHGLAGARLGIVTAHADLLEMLAETRLEHAVSCAALTMGSAVLELTDEFEAIWSDIKSSRALAADRLGSTGVRVVPSGGNFLSFHLGSNARAAAVQQRLSDVGYRVKHLTDDAAFSDCVRVTIQDQAAMHATLDRVLEVIDATMLEHGY